MSGKLLPFRGRKENYEWKAVPLLIREGARLGKPALI